MKYILILFSLIFLTSCASINTVQLSLRGTKQSSRDAARHVQKSATYLHQIFDIIEDGDMITRMGNKLWSHAIRNLNETDKRFSHIGIIRVRDGKHTVIHVAGTLSNRRDLVREEPLSDFLRIASKVGVFRAINTDGSKISDIAVEYIGVPYDWALDMLCDESVYCTELIYLVLKRVNPTIVLNTMYVPLFGHHIIPIDAITTSEHFKEVFYFIH